MMQKILFSLLLLALPALTAAAQEKYTPNTLRLKDGAVGEKAAISEMGWLAGRWSGTGLGGRADEDWGTPREGVMLGTFRMLKDNKPVFYEFMTLEERGGSLVLRVKHFTPELVAWEEKDRSVDFPFIKKDGKRLYFNGLTFERNSSDSVRIYLVIGQKDGTFREETFEYTRVK